MSRPITGRNIEFRGFKEAPYCNFAKKLKIPEFRPQTDKLSNMSYKIPLFWLEDDLLGVFRK